MPRTLAIVVAYHPEESLIVNIGALLEQVSHVIIVDNESSEGSKAILQKTAKPAVSFIFNEVNQGVAKGFNQGIRWGIDNGYDYFLLMDQDSRPQERMVERLLEVAEANEKKDQLVLIGPHHEDFDRKIPVTSTAAVETVPLLITSGSLLSRKIIDKIGYYDEWLFIDHVDHDYCLRLTQTGGSCAKVNMATLLHRFGDAEVRTFLGKSFFIQSYSPFRRYHMMRNRIVLYKRYGVLSGAWFWMDLRSAVKDLIKLVLFESDRGPKLRAVIKGGIDGFRWRG